MIYTFLKEETFILDCEYSRLDNPDNPDKADKPLICH